MRPSKELLKVVSRYKFLEACIVLGQCTVVTLIKGEIIGVGLSRCSPKDEWDVTMGHRIARGRALKDFAQKVHASHQKSIGSAMGASVSR